MLWLGHRLRHSQLPFALCISHARPSIIMTLHQIISLSLSLSLSLKKDELCDCISIPRFISTCQLYGVVLVLRSCHCVQRYLLDLKRCLIFSTVFGLTCPRPTSTGHQQRIGHGGDTVGTRPMPKKKAEMHCTSHDDLLSH